VRNSCFALIKKRKLYFFEKNAKGLKAKGGKNKGEIKFHM